MGQLVQATKAALTGEESTARDVQRRSLVVDALQLLGQHEASLAKAYPMALLEIFAESPSPSGPHAVDDTGMDFPELTLLDEAEMQDQVELARALQRAMHATDAVLTELNTLVSAARGLRSVQPERNPLRPENYLRALQKVVAETGVVLPVRQLWMQHMREVLGSLLVEEYTSAADSLRAQGVEPVGYTVLGTPAGEAGRSSHNAPQHSAWPGAGYSSGYAGHSMGGPVPEYGMQAPDGPGLGGSTDWPGDMLQAPMSWAAEEALLTVGILHQMLTGGGDPHAFDPHDQALADPQTGGQDSAWSDSGAGSVGTPVGLAERGQGGFFSDDVPGAMPGMARLERLVGRLSRGPAAGGAAWQEPGVDAVAHAVSHAGSHGVAMGGAAHSAEAAMEVVARMMENIAHDARLLPPVQHALQKLEPALQQLVQHDGHFFTDEMHPARQLLDELTQRSLAFEAEDAPGFSQFMRLLCEAVDHLAATDIHDAGSFAAVLKALHAAWDSQEHKVRSQQSGADKSLQQSERRKRLAEKIAADIRLLPNLEPVPAEVLAFVTGPWANVVALAQITQVDGVDGAEGDPGGYLALVPLLLWSVQPALTRAEPDRLTRAIPGILATVRAGLKSIDHPVAQTSSFLQRLVGLHQAAFERSGRAAVAPAVAAPQDDPLDAELVAGVWVELITHHGAVRTQLTWAHPHGTLFLFTAADGSTQSMTRRMLDRLVSEGSLRVVPDAAPASARAPVARPVPLRTPEPGKSGKPR